MRYLPFLLILASCTTEYSPSYDLDLTVGPITSAGLRQAKDTTFDLYQATISSTCRAKINTGLNIDYLKQVNLRTACGTTLNIGGCSYATSGQVYIEDVLHNDQKTHVHEFMHVLLGCQINSSDGNHTNAVWGRIEDAF